MLAPEDKRQSSPSIGKSRLPRRVDPFSFGYDELARITKDIDMPAAFLIRENFVRNLETLADLASNNKSKTIRIVTKSIRVPELIKEAVTFLKARDIKVGLMCYSPREAAYLLGQGVCSDILMAYPIVNKNQLDLIALLAKIPGVDITLMIDSEEHIKLITNSIKDKRSQKKIKVCLDVDAGLLLPAGVHIGAKRSPLRSLDDVERMLETLKRYPEVELVGVMSYDSQVAGVADTGNGVIKDAAISLIKNLSKTRLARRRKELKELLDSKGISLEFINGGGTGSLLQTLQDPVLTEASVGSGLLGGHYFDRYTNNPFVPALLIGLRISRIPEKGVVTCHGGGFVASGPMGKDRYLLPVLPESLQPFSQEMYGEVQTPLKITGKKRICKLRIGDPLFFRSTKSGEVLERFGNVYVIDPHEITTSVKTYRGDNREFH